MNESPMLSAVGRDILLDSVQVAAWIIHNSPEAAAVVDISLPGTPVVQINQAFAAMTANNITMATKAAGSASTLPDLLGLDDTSADWLALSEHLTAGLPAQLQCRAYRQQREAFWAAVSCRPLTPPPHHAAQYPARPTLAIVVVRDDSAAWLSAQAMRHQTRRVDTLLAEIDDAVLQADGALVLSGINPAAQALTGWTAVAAVGRPLGDVVQLVHQHTGAALSNPLLSALLTGEENHSFSNAALQREDGSRVPVTYRTVLVCDDEGKAIEGLLLLRNASAATILADAVVHSAGHDALTELPNRSTFEDRFTQALALAGRHERLCAILLIEVADFAQTIQTFGQDAGDGMLKVLASRLRTIFRRSDTVCRLGDARFAVVLPQVDNQATPDVLAAKACSGASQPVQINGTVLNANLRVGVAIYPMDGDTLPKLMDCAAAQL